MSVVLFALLLQSLVIPPDRASLPNPASSTQVPKQLQKDYDSVWTSFRTGKQDSRVLSDTDKLLKKDKDFVPALLLQAYVHHYAGDGAQAERKIEQVLGFWPADRMSLEYLAEAAFSRGEFLKASDFYGRLLATDTARADFETKQQKARLLALQGVLEDGQRSVQENRWFDAEGFYRQALKLAPEEPSFHGQLGSVLLQEQKWDEAAAAYRRQTELQGKTPEASRGLAQALTGLGRADEAWVITDGLSKSLNDGITDPRLAELSDLGRWAGDIDLFRQTAATSVVTREQLAWLLARYFPQIEDFPRTSEIVTDVQQSWAGDEILIVVAAGILDSMPNHTFQPARTVTQGEFALALARLSRVFGLTDASTLAKIAPSLALEGPPYGDFRLVTALGLLASGDSGTFEVSASLSGREAVNAAEKLLRLIE